MIETKLYYRNFMGPIGDLTLISDGHSLIEIKFGPVTNTVNSNKPILLETEKQLSEYFKKERKVFSIKLDPIGTEFQLTVWNKLLQIPYGETISYQELASRIGKKNASRAVGNANGKNPIPIIIPCHRVIRKNGSFGGYAGGLKVKKYLLELEK
ncbi:MAG: methylated-DNA--[protein]-cysteine S-methyltransferase [Candidatus Tenebribacter davisii]|nr:methylated-DNA--[protein]-cysteine S-methyltransferase [Candidatus Tenebribacter davisii]